MEVRKSLKGDQRSTVPRKYVDLKAVKGQNVLDAAASRSAMNMA